MDRIITIKNPANDNLGSIVQSLLDAVAQLNAVNTGDKVILDLSRLKFVHSLLILPICAFLNKFDFFTGGIDYKLNNTIDGYLKTIHFPESFTALSDPNWNDYLSVFKTKSYLPICQIPVDFNNTRLREYLLTVFENILLHQLQISGQMVIVIKYLISEAMDNIVEHSGVSSGWIMVQNFSKKGFLDVCILDTGLRLLGSYQKFNFPDIETDDQALKQAVNGNSTKQLAVTRGYGIDTSRRMLVDGLKGKYFLFSGAAFYVYTSEIEQIIPLERINNWNGTILALRTPPNLFQLSLTI